jgi:uncharacterized Ntn-hydrolase superfamily protein
MRVANQAPVITPRPKSGRNKSSQGELGKAARAITGKKVAAIVVHNEAPSTNSYPRNIDLRTDSSKDSVGELRTLFDAYKLAFKIK